MLPNFQPIQLNPVGVVRNLSKEASWGAAFGALDWRERSTRMKEQSQMMSEIIINADLDGILDGIDEFSHLMILYWAHMVHSEKRRTTRVHPLGSADFPLVGVFATHSPSRPNSILTSVVRLIGRDGNILRVTGLDALNDSPVLDIKPYLPESPCSGDVKMPDWMKQIREIFQTDR